MNHTPHNQCDGCQSGATLRDGKHVNNAGLPFMVCQREQYTEPLRCLSCGSQGHKDTPLDCGH